MKHYQILIIGGGTSEITIAAQLRKKDPSLQMAIIEPSSKHYYQAAWTLVGAGAYDFKETERDEADFIPKGVDWIKDKAIGVDPDKNEVSTATTGIFTYDYLIPVPGLVMAPDFCWNRKHKRSTVQTLQLGNCSKREEFYVWGQRPFLTI